ncbi:complement C1q tumor necrosis factor-related protein 3-like [Narcine bancroftii]|uniref:complement C1q tumor necrosis factor-related protein 3-like n=1 Tax=Narcine bancroftii TaxID=1343680 RepID=UPI0038322E09
MEPQRLRHLVYWILLQTWASESLGAVVQADVHEMSGENNVLEFIEETVEKLGPQADVNLGPKVIFDVWLKGNGKIVTPVNSIIYDEVIVNMGGGYNPKTGKFTSPRCGVYFFSYSSLPGRGMQTDVALMKNGKEVSLIHSVLANKTSQTSIKNIIIELHKGDEVWVELLTGNLWSKADSLSFQGFLLAQP